MSRTKNPNTRSRWYIKRVPALPGVYEVEDLYGDKALTYFAYWNGVMFMARGLTQEFAYRNRTRKSDYGPYPKRWRGLLHQPATHPAPATNYCPDNQYAMAA